MKIQAFALSLLWTIAYCESKVKTKCNINIVVVYCKPNGANMSISANISTSHHTKVVNMDNMENRQLQQVMVLLRSIALTERFKHGSSIIYKQRGNGDCVNFIIVGKHPEVLDEVRNSIQRESWGSEFLNRIKLSFVLAQYPAEYAWMENSYRTCATLRIFLPNTLLAYDKVLYVDTDIIFLRPPSLLYSVFNHFDTQQLAALTPEFVIDNNIVDGLYNPQWYNTGVMLMHLERMRKVHWTSQVAMLAELGLANAFYGDQDILTLYFKYFRDYLLDLPCHWNFMIKYCTVLDKCAESTGISALHGVAGSFFFNDDVLFKKTFKFFQSSNFTAHQFGLDTFVQQLGDLVWVKRMRTPKRGNSCGRSIIAPQSATSFASGVMQSLQELQSLTNPVRIARFQQKELLFPKSHSKLTYLPKVNQTIFQTKVVQLNPVTVDPASKVVIAMTFVNLEDQGLLVSMMESLSNESPMPNLQIIVLTVNHELCSWMDSDLEIFIENHWRLDCVIVTLSPEHYWIQDFLNVTESLPLFLPDILPSTENIIYVDRAYGWDRHILKYWKEFDKFEPPHAIGVGPCTENAFSMMLLNVEKMRKRNWTRKMLMVSQVMSNKLRNLQTPITFQAVMKYYFKHHSFEVLQMSE